MKLQGHSILDVQKDISIMCVCVHGEDFSVWMLKDYSSSEWVLKYQVPLVDICQGSYTDLTHCNVKRRFLLANGWNL